jgi:hypothetical protein
MEQIYSATLLAENMIAQCDEEGNQFILLEGIVDHKRDENAISKEEGYFYHNDRRYWKKTTKGWKLCVEWKDGTTTWESLSALKESNPVEVAQYAVSNKIDDEPAFAWRVPFTLKKQESIISAVNKRYWKRTHKFGIRLPHTVEEALEIDKENNNDLWERSLQKEMANVIIAFKMIGKGIEPPPGY